MNPTTQTAEQRFRSIEWCAVLLNRPGTTIFTPSCRLVDALGLPASQDQILRTTLNNSDAVPHCLGFYQDPASSSTPGSPASPTQPRLLINSSSALFDLQPGVNGYHGSTHGGFMAVLIDDSMGGLIYHNFVLQMQKQQEPGWNPPPGTLDLSKIQYFTAGMNIRLEKPLKTPAVVVVTSTLNRVEGRKLYLDVVVEDGNGTKYATCEGLWMSLPNQKI
ncbi:unnamed protein product [Clonostachys rosea f. rosea IK726]|jgi:acyl-coenzyme A thioesterase PaaI-like protein|uniref:Thioesterase domain-containing protein n=2 Tax=Bionectria ochroleuca TaxID=29856 RepID=A0A8H7K5K5_BIOOC|nr:unnamed protein product [Clonostachys rosea f. rosea IK726]